MLAWLLKFNSIIPQFPRAWKTTMHTHTHTHTWHGVEFQFIIRNHLSLAHNNRTELVTTRASPVSTASGTVKSAARIRTKLDCCGAIVLCSESKLCSIVNWLIVNLINGCAKLKCNANYKKTAICLRDFVIDTVYGS